MRVTLRYAAQVRTVKGLGCEEIELSDGACADDAVRLLAASGREELRQLLLTPEGAVQPTLLLFLQDAIVPRGQRVRLSHGDTLTIISPISGG